MLRSVEMLRKSSGAGDFDFFSGINHFMAPDRQRSGDFSMSVHPDGKVLVFALDQKFLQKAFERYSMKENNKNKLITRSSGIGLFLVKKMVEEQNGSINISSKLNEGTCIEIILKRGKDCDKHK